MTINQMKRVLAGCRQGKNMLLISEKSGRSGLKNDTYFAVFSHFVEKQDERFTDGPCPPNWLYLTLNAEGKCRCKVLRDVASIEVVSIQMIRSLNSSCLQILKHSGKKINTSKLNRDQLKHYAALLNSLLDVNPKDNT